VTERLELTAAARYDDEQYKNGTYTDRELSTVIPVTSPSGALEDLQKEKANAFQPKGQVSFHFNTDLMAYATVSRGFRAGYYQSGAFTLPEHTTNYELGLKSTWWDRRIVANFAAFHIDYADQQIESILITAPFRSSITIPKTDINGLEYESNVLLSRFVSVGLGMSYLNAPIANGGGQSPDTPHFNASANADLTYPILRDWKAKLHFDDRFNSLQYLALGNQQAVPAKTFVNLRAGVQNDHYSIMAFVRNATDEREPTIVGVAGIGGFIRYQNEPRSYGVEVKASF
jgi:iron complex outermembrane receptor protein